MQGLFKAKLDDKILVCNSRPATPAIGEEAAPATTRFEGTDVEMAVLKEVAGRLDADSASFRPPAEKPVAKYYGGATEILQYVSRYEQLHAPEKDYDALLRDLRTRALPHSLEETGQKAVDSTFDEAALLRTPDSQGRRLGVGEQPGSPTRRAPTFAKIRSRDVKQQCIEISAQLSARALDSQNLQTGRATRSRQFAAATVSGTCFGSSGGGAGTARTGTEGRLTKTKSHNRSS